MAEQLGKIEKPEARSFGQGRRLFFIPLVFSPPKPDAEFLKRYNKYWDQVEEHLANLEQKLGRAARVYHEMVPEGSENEVEALAEFNVRSYQLTKARTERGAVLQPVEDGETLAEFMDYSRCLSLGLQSRNVFTHIYQSLAETQKKRNEHIARRLDKTLQPGEAGILLLREGHQVQFPEDVQVFYISPPAFDELKRWLREQDAAAESQAASEEPAAGPQDGQGDAPA